MVAATITAVERQVVDQIGDFKSLSQQSGDVQARFVKNLSDDFDKLMDREVIKDEAVFNFETLSLVKEEELEVIVALEGMVNAARNEHLPIFISFNTRLSSLFPRKRIDESSNPLDPEQVATAFQEALRPIGLDAQNTLSVYRAFNREVLKHLDEVLKEANGVLINSKIIPDLGLESAQKGRQPPARNRPRAQDDIGSFGTVEEETFEEEERPELFSIMQNLLHFDEPAASEEQASNDTSPSSMPGQGAVAVPAGPDGQNMVPEGQQQYMIPAGMVPTGFAPADQVEGQSGMMQPFQPQDGQQVEMVDQNQLMEILTNIQQTLKASSPQQVPGTIEDVERLDINQSLSEILKATTAKENVVSAVDRQSSDIINLVTLLFEAIWQDPSVPIPIKELIGRTQITIIKVALADTEFFNNENHPARAILNEFAAAGIGWTEVEALEEDPLYQKIQQLVERIQLHYEDNNELFEDLITDFRTFRAMEAAKTRHLEQRILKADERKERLDDIHELVTQKIEERVLGRELHPFVEELLHGPFHKFMVMLVLKEGPGGNAWKQSINTIDVLLWSVQPHEQDGDRDRLGTVNPRLLNNLRKAFRIATVDKEEIDELIAQLERVQLETFHQADEVSTETTEPASGAPLDDTSSEEPAETGAVTFHAASTESDADEDHTEKAEEAESSIEMVVASDEVTTASGDQEISGTEHETVDPGAEKSATVEEDLASDDPALIQVENLSVGMWVEFAGEDDLNTRCKLAAKINAIDKYIFVNRQGVKVVEKTKMGLAREIHDGTVNIISDGLLFSRALESVIGNLRESQHEQHTASAYQPSSSTLED